MMDLQPGRAPEITDADVVEAGGRVRWLTVQRLEKLWTVIETSVDAARADERPVDPRMLELGLRLLKQQTDLYRLARPAPEPEEEEDEVQLQVDRRAMITAELDRVEERLRGTEPGSSSSP